jgi:hypothetical protein
VLSVDFTRDVLPILEARCLSCHGADAARLRIDTRLDTRLSATALGAGGRRPIEPGSPERSSVMTSIQSTGSDRMPPSEALPAREVDILRQWILDGAPYAEHWAWSSPAHVEVPASDASHPVDAFIEATLDRVGVEPSERALPATELRRASLVLTGLPPSLEALDAFVADPSDAAYAAAIDGMLASDRHAEHLARDWLDHVGYSDSNGMYMDTERDMSAWREWVIAAFRSNMPLDDFIVAQLAGDLGESPSTDDQLATALLRLHRTTEEGGIDLEEFRALYSSLRAEMVGNTLLGVTLQCARCHNHRYDPFTQRDYFRLTACFDRVRDPGGTPPLFPRDARPVLAARGPLQREALDEAHVVLSAEEGALAALDLDAAMAEWEVGLREEPAWAPVSLTGLGTREGTTLDFDGDTITASGASPHLEQWDLQVALHGPLTALRLSNFTSRSEVVAVISEIRLRIESLVERRTIPFEAIPETASSDTDPAPVDALNDGTNMRAFSTDGHALLVIPTMPVTLAEGETLHVLIDLGRGDTSTLATLTLEVSGETSATLPDALRAILSIDPSERTATQRAQIRAHFARFAATGEANEHAAEVRRLQREVERLTVTPRTRVMRDDDPSRVTHVLARGDFYRPLEEVTCGVPAVLAGGRPGEAGAGDMHDRAELAAFLVSEANPITARVLANRLFQLIFGRGIVASTQDFGMRGALPSHPELLDWLTMQLIDSGWDARALLRVLVTSDAFRRSSVERDDLRELDPANALWARGPRRPLAAEELRDQALLISGLLVEQLGGPSVRPYHPEGIYEQLIDVADGPMRTYRPDLSPMRVHRRAMYTFWRRGTLLPSLSLLDAPDRLGPVPSRAPTITPTQALALMNEPLFVEAARHLAERALRETVSVEDAIVRMFRLATGRLVTDEEQAILLAQYQSELDAADADASVRGVLAIGESDRHSPRRVGVTDDRAANAHAAMTMVARTILTLTETLTEE